MMYTSGLCVNRELDFRLVWFACYLHLLAPELDLLQSVLVVRDNALLRPITEGVATSRPISSARGREIMFLLM